jgi:hypothetical protein
MAYLKDLDRTYSSGAFWGRSALYQSKTLTISAGVIVAIVRGIGLDARNMSILSA